MTYPITPNPAIHRATSADVAKQRQINVTQMQAMGQQLMQGVANSLLSILTGGLITPPSSSQSQAAAAALRTLWATIQSDLATLQSDAEASTAAFGTFLHALQTAVTNDAGNWTALIADFQSAWDTYTTTESGLLSSEIATIQQIINSLLGINTTTGKMNASNVSNVLGGSNLGADVSSVSSWSTRLTNDLLIISDVFHLTYAAGTSTDPPGTLSGGRPTWYSAWNDLLALTGLVNSVTPPTDPAPTVGAVVQGTQSAVATGITGNVNAPPNNTAVQTAVSGLTQSVAGLQSQVSALQAPLGSPTTILRDSGQDSAGSGLGSNWTRTQTAAVNRDASSGFTWQSSGAVSRTCVGIYNSALATTDQVGTIVLNVIMGYNSFNPTGAPYSLGAPENWILQRVDSPTTPTSWVGVRIRYADVQFGYLSGGTITMLGSPTTFYATASSSYTFYAGDASSDYNYKLVSGGRTVASYTDAGHVTSGTLTGRYPGQIWKSDAGNFTLSGTPIECYPAATSWLSYDASASVGTPMLFGWVTRLSTTGVSLNASGMLPFDFFDNTVSMGSGFTLPTAGNAGIQVSQAGVYTFSWGLRQPSTSNATDYWPGIAVNGTLVEVGPTFMYDGGGTLLTGGNFGMASAGLLCNAGDVISPVQLIGNFGTSSGLSPAGGTFSGESTGVRSYLKIAKIG